MRLILSIDDIVFKYDNKFYATHNIHALLVRYTSTFTDISLVSRVKEIGSENIDKLFIIDISIFTIIEIPYFNNTKTLIKNSISIFSKIISLSGDIGILRVPSILSIFVLYTITWKKIPFALEFVANAKELSEISPSFMNKKLWLQIDKMLKKSALDAVGNAYVTKKWLQREYPGNFKDSYFEASYSTIELKAEFFSNTKKYTPKTKFILSHLAKNFKNNSKGHDTLIQVVKYLTDNGYNVVAKCAGAGSGIEKYKKYAQDLGIEEKIEFVGYLSSENDLRNFLISSDIFLFPSRSEGLPRSVIEAMAVGLPCVASNVGGMKELIDDRFIMEAEDIIGFANKIIQLMTNEEMYNDASRQNMKSACKFEASNLQIIRNEFYTKIKNTITGSI